MDLTIGLARIGEISNKTNDCSVDAAKNRQLQTDLLPSPKTVNSPCATAHLKVSAQAISILLYTDLGR